MHPMWPMAERVGCARSLRSLRLPPVAEPLPLTGEGSHLTVYFYYRLASRSFSFCWRRGWDSNPRPEIIGNRFSRAAP